MVPQSNGSSLVALRIREVQWYVLDPLWSRVGMSLRPQLLSGTWISAFRMKAEKAKSVVGRTGGSLCRYGRKASSLGP